MTPEFSRTDQRVTPPADYMTREIIDAPPVNPLPRIAPDIADPIDPGPDLGVGRDGDDRYGDDRYGDDRDGDDHPPTEAGPSPSLVASLQAVQGYPCVSLLLTTRPGDRLHPDDAARLERLRLDAVRRLRAEGLLDDHEALVADLDRLMQRAIASPADRGLALYAGAGTAEAVPLPVEVEERTVVDPTFATRDLVRALHRTPRHVVLVLSRQRAAALDGAGGRLVPVLGTHFPVDLTGAGSLPPDGPSPGGLSPGGLPPDGDALAPALRRVDLALGAYLRLRPAPVVIVGPQALVTAFREVSRNLGRLAGAVYGAFDDVGPDELARRTAPVLRRYLASREIAALKLLEDRRGEARAVSGVAAAWLASRVERPEMLIVEEGFRYPARLSPNGDVPTPASDVDAPDVVDDLVDELIEVVLDRGGWVALARDGALEEDGRVALTVR